MTSLKRVYLACTQGLSGPAAQPSAVYFRVLGDVRPSVERTLPVAEQFRRGIMGSYRRQQQKHAGIGGYTPNSIPPMSPVFSGKDSRENPLTGHRHAFYLPTDEDGDGFIEHLTVFCGVGFDNPELDALRNLHWLSFGADSRLRLELIALGGLSESSAALATESAVWVSATPFVASRHPKRRGRRRDRPELLESGGLTAFVTEVLLEEIGRLRVERPEMPAPVSVTPILDDHSMYCISGGRRARAFVRSRLRHGESDRRRPFGTFRIVFPEPVRGPICLGRSCHFGLGLFVPEM
jgi:CRISPR-associated protein Csb2